MKFKLFFEANDPKPFLVAALEKFPQNTDLLVLADALEDDGDSVLAGVVRNLASHKDKSDVNHYIYQAREELNKHNVYLDYTSNTITVLPSNEKFEWRGNVVVKINSYMSGAKSNDIMHIEDIHDVNVLRGLAVLAAKFFADTNAGTHQGLREFHTTKGKLSRQGKAQATQDAQVRYAIRYFLNYFELFEELVQKLNVSQRPRHDDMYQVERLINYRNYGYLWEVPMTREILQKFVTANGTTPFLSRLSERIFSALNIIPNRVNEDPKMVADLRQIAEMIRTK